VSEFGAGVVVPLVKMTEHLQDHWALKLRAAFRWKALEPSERLKLMEGELDPEFADVIALTRIMDIDQHITVMASIWANGASDHLLDLDLQKAPQSLKTLRDILLKMRYMKDDEEFNENHWNQIKDLWKEAAMDIDEAIGTVPIWGEGDAR
jgi:hypothetical protein